MCTVIGGGRGRGGVGRDGRCRYMCVFIKDVVDCGHLVGVNPAWILAFNLSRIAPYDLLCKQRRKLESIRI
jgi:hypothetical protein